jgi:hypothetical protein
MADIADIVDITEIVYIVLYISRYESYDWSAVQHLPSHNKVHTLSHLVFPLSSFNILKSLKNIARNFQVAK